VAKGFPASPLQRFHDRRCPSGSGWGEAPARACLRAARRGRSREGHADGGSHRPLARETSVGASCALSNGYVRGRKVPGDVGRESEAEAIRGRARGASLDHETEVSIQKRLRRFTVTKPDSGRKPGVGWRLRSSRAKAREASRARKRELGMLGDVGIGRFAGCARGLFVLQKSTSGVWSSTASNQGARGSSPPALHSVRRGEARRVKGRR
jgi:hypothetical protein